MLKNLITKNNKNSSTPKMIFMFLQHEITLIYYPPQKKEHAKPLISIANNIYQNFYCSSILIIPSLES